MFTGIIEEVGTVCKISKGAHSAVLTVSAKEILSDVRQGDSIAVNGVCLTVTSFTDATFSTDVMHETIKRSYLLNLRPGSSVNLERAMPVQGRFGGHIVAGHIDGTGVISSIKKDDRAVWYTIRADKSILRYIVEKGSIAVDGISLTVVRVSGTEFCISVIPHTAERTTLAQKRVGDTVNLENDCLGKYIEKFLVVPELHSGVTKELLTKAGY